MKSNLEIIEELKAAGKVNEMQELLDVMTKTRQTVFDRIELNNSKGLAVLQDHRHMKQIQYNISLIQTAIESI